jgi:putative ATPase
MNTNYIPPLAERMRPTTIAEVVGQSHLLGVDKPLYKLLTKGNLQSILLWGPPGVGKTTLARIIAESVGLPFFTLSAIDSGVKDVRNAIEKAAALGRAVLFVDEIHRFSKSQQDSLLGAVEKGTIILIGATTENPSFEVINALLSRCTTYVLESLSREELTSIYQRAIHEDEELRQKNIIIAEDEALLAFSGGDARKLLNILELICQSSDHTVEINNSIVETSVQRKTVQYDKKGEFHYDIISAFIKSIRGSDPNAAVYWLARMIEGGEDAKFIARRLVILAAEDIGLANPNALLMANTCFDAVHKIGFPESRIILSQCAIYLACCEKSNAAYLAIDKALAMVQETKDLEVPLHLRNAPTKLMKSMNYGTGYQYAHDFPNGFVDQEFLPDALQNTTFYNPSANLAEEKARLILKKNWPKYKY